jgi:hypothetical protein
MMLAGMPARSVNIYIGNHANPLYVEDWVYLLLISFRAAGYEATFSTTTLETDKLNIVLECFNPKSFDYFRERSVAGARSIVIATEFLTGDTFNCFDGHPLGPSNPLAAAISPLVLKLQRRQAGQRYAKAIYLREYQERARYFFQAVEMSEAIWTVNEAQTPAYLARFEGKKAVAQLPMTFLDHEVYRVEPPLPRKDYDIFFGGTFSHYRRNLLKRWGEDGRRIITSTPDQPNLLRNHKASRSRLVLDLKQHESWPYVSNFRLHYHLCRGDYVASESRRERTNLCRYVNQLPEDTYSAVEELLANPGGLHEQGLEMRERFRDEQPAHRVFKEFLEKSPV